MVRFKNRHLLVEFLSPASLAPFPAVAETALVDQESAGNAAPPNTDDLDDAEDPVRIPDLPFLAPAPNGKPKPKELKDGAGEIYRAVRTVVQDVFGDEGWGRVASSFKVVYHSPLTTLTLIRIARPHYRLLWAAVSLVTSLAGQAVLPRIVAVSGTIKKLQGRAMAHHRRVIAEAVAGLIATSNRETEDKANREREAIARLTD